MPFGLVKALATNSDNRRGDELTGIKVCRLATVPFFLLSQLKTQAEFLQGNGFKVTMVSSCGPEVEALKHASIEHATIDIPRSISPWRDVLALWNLYRFFRKQQFDVVHSTTPKAGLLASIASLVAGTPVRLHTFTGQQWVSMVGLTRFVSRLADRLIGLLNTRCYADSRSQRQFLVSEGLIASGQIKVIGHGSLAGVDLVRFDSDRWSEEEKSQIKKKLRLSQTAKILIFIGRISREKGVFELLDAFRQVREDNKYEVELLLLGPLDNDCGGSGSVGREVLAAEGVHYIGYTDMPEKYLVISDLLCLPSYREGFGTVVIEAAAMGVPVLGTRINGLIDAVEDGKTGVLVPVINEQVLCKSLCNLLDNPHVINKLGEAARKRCRHLFDANFIGALVAKEYRDLLAQYGRK